MAGKRTVPKPNKKYFTVAEANKALPLVQAIVKDIAELAKDLHERHERLSQVKQPVSGTPDDPHTEEFRQAVAELERDQERMLVFESELKELGVELKDYYTGLIDFPCWKESREVYLCWRLGEDNVAHWHEIDAGFAGRQKIQSLELCGRG